MYRNVLTYFSASCMLFTFCTLRLCYGEESNGGNQDEGGNSGELKQEVKLLKKQLDEMKEKYTDQIQRLNEKIEKLEEKKEGEGKAPASKDSELAELRRLAQAQAGKEAEEEEEKEKEEESFKMGGLSLQALNPELSVTGDMTGQFQYKDTTSKRWEYDFRCLGIHFESYLDPYSKLKAAVPVNEDGAKLGEAYFTRFGALNLTGFNMTFAKFRQQFGVVNRWHKHGLDQVDFPLPLKKIFGGEDSTRPVFQPAGAFPSCGELPKA